MLERAPDYESLTAAFRWSIPERYNIGVDACDKWADGTNRLALIHLKGDGGVARYSFDDLKVMSNRLANALRARGVARGERIGILLPQAPETAVAHLAAYQLGCIAVPLSKYQHHNTRICRAVGLSSEDRADIVAFMTDRLGLHYDMRNIFDLLRYFFPTPPVPVRWRRRMLAFGSGDPTRAICSSLIAQAFQSIRYPILPEVVQNCDADDYVISEHYHIRHHSLFAPRDFDLSPYFDIVKPNLVGAFEYRDLVWKDKPKEAKA